MAANKCGTTALGWASPNNRIYRDVLVYEQQPSLVRHYDGDKSQWSSSSWSSESANSSTSTLGVAAQQTTSSISTSTTPSPSPTTSSAAAPSTAAAVSSDLTSTSISSETSVTSSASASFSSQVSSSTSTISTTSQSSAAASSQPPISTSPVSASSSSSNGNTTNTETVTSTETLSSTTTLVNTITSVPDVSLTSLTTSQVQSATISVTQANTTGAVHTSLETSGHTSALPFPTPVFNATSTLSLVQTSTLTGAGPTATANVTTIQAGNIFVAIQTDAPPSQVTSRGDHPVPTLGIQQQQERLQTNKFYANFFLGDQTAGTWTHPYSVAWSKGTGETGSWGLAVSHIERDQLAGSNSRDPSLDAGQVGFFAAPVGIQSMVLSAAELDANSTLTTDTLTSFSVNVNLMARGAQNPTITFPLVQGMAFITGSYGGGTPMLQSGIGITNLTYAGAVVGNTTYKYRASLNDGFDWLIYVTPANAFYNENSFTLLTTGEIQGPSGFGGHIQLAKVPANSTDAENVYDASAGAYPTTASISGSVSGTSGSYTISWTKAGVTSQQLLMFALPHHMESLAYESSGGITDVQLITTTKGMATAIRGDSWTLDEPNLPIDMSFAPWSPELGSVVSVSAAAEDAINAAGYAELSQNISQQTNVGSLYYDGKALAKFATIIYTVNDIANNKSLALTGLALLETAFALHVNNQMQIPIVYDTVWGGAVSAGSYNGGSSGVDFGNTYYNDHHFHYGYFVYAAAVIGYMRPAWLSEGSNAAWTNMLVRDYANSVTDDEFFPFQRMFDWYHGHSWAHGLIETADGKDQESSSEDTMASYAVKMWGRISGDVNMEARGNLMLSVQQRSLGLYYLYLGNNTVEPADFIGNKVAGILFENKIDHTTYFGAEPEYIQGIHMLPQMPCSTLTRSKEFVQQEWDAYFGPQGIKPVEQVSGGWRGILMANLATIDPVNSYDFFSNSTGNFSVDYLDGGASQTWYLAWSAALGGSQAGSGKVRREAAEGRGKRTVSLVGDEDGFIGERSARGSLRSSRLRQRTRR
ncbi:endo-1,3-beta glucanase [Friedmanniomyces endolithicus]|uniref:glucan endo-1,3-beta-D-glucosidase n=1 Tax=Friedmanniomyces endolithicus TaxID=329885 RepID=A0AAN6FCH4_9PEZI|nr:endo-1,3-beta glucanase [Friedmanniomyces endolithicus]KAK0270960.1 endo-1,3-beta glucanase [Friedmanniomyces endolithicus]KAK0271883.1 endo-1,3-beta glucanase [Friedmanniomyces endolithicus]KAK0305787.1 endo-1,3-beta glucanase [Friedmanniomyces endolithicus]KAK0314130.1 endo-1,3-beta glucanase [Friedmanniomyces endolithicus]